jgi:O-Antigen ligase
MVARSIASLSPSGVALLGLAFLFPMGPRFALGFGNLYLATALTLLWLALWSVFEFAGPRGGGLSLRLPAQRAILVYGLFLIVQLLVFFPRLIEDPAAPLRGIQFIAHMAIFTTVSSMRVPRDVPKLLARFTLLALLVECALAWSSRADQVHGFLTGTFDHQHSSFASYLVLVLPIVAAYLLAVKSQSLRLLLSLLLVFGVASLAFSFSRTAYVAAPVSFLVLMHAHGGRRALVGGVAFLIVAGAIAGSFANSELRDRFISILEATSGEKVDVSFGSRLSMWRGVLQDVVRTAFLGIGLFGYYVIDNFFMRSLGETGLIGLGLFLWVVVSILVWLRKAWRSELDGEMRALCVGLYAASFGLLIVMNLGGDMFLLHRVMGLYWLLLGSIVGASLPPERAEEETTRMTA